MRQEISFGKLKLTNNKGASSNNTQVETGRVGIFRLGPLGERAILLFLCLIKCLQLWLQLTFNKFIYLCYYYSFLLLGIEM